MQFKPILVFVSIYPLCELTLDLFFSVKRNQLMDSNDKLCALKSTHSGTFSSVACGYNLILGYYPNGYFYRLSLKGLTTMLKHSFHTSLNICNPTTVFYGGGFAGRAGLWNSQAAVSLVSF